MEKKQQNLKFYNTSSTYTSTLNEMNKTFFPSLTHKELVSIHDLKLRKNYNIRSNVYKNFHRNYHSEIMKTNLNNNSRHFSLNTYNKTEVQFPVLKTEKNEPVYKFYINSNTLSSIINDSVKKNIKINYKTIFNQNSNSKKCNVSNVSTSANASPSVNTFKYSVLDKIKSNSVDFNGSLFNLEKGENSVERIINAQKSINTSSFSLQNPNNKTKTINNYSIEVKNEFNKKFVSSLNPLYSIFKKDPLSEFYKKSKDINYLKFIFMKNKKDIEIEEEKVISKKERLDQMLFTINMLQNLFDKYHVSKNEYLNYLKKETSKETEKNEILKEEKITLMKEIYIIRHKTLRLENRFKNYLDDKFFLLSVKNHSFNIDKFLPEDREDYNKDLKKLDLLNYMLKITSKEYDNEIDKDKLRGTRLFGKNDLLILNSPSKTRRLQRGNTKRSTSKGNNNTSSPYFSKSKKSKIDRYFEVKPIYEDVYYFNKDLQETTQKIQDSLDEYNNISKELNVAKQYLAKDMKEMKNIKDYEAYLKNEISSYKNKVENLKKLNNGLINYKKYLQNIFILNLNKGQIFDKVNMIINNIELSDDKELMNFIISEFNDYRTYFKHVIDRLRLIERATHYLIDFKKNQIKNKNEKYYLIQKQIDDTNRQKLCQKKQDYIKNKFDSLIQKVVDKNNRIIFIPRKKVNIPMHLRKNKKEEKDKKDDDYFGNFDFF